MSGRSVGAGIALVALAACGSSGEPGATFGTSSITAATDRLPATDSPVATDAPTPTEAPTTSVTPTTAEPPAAAPEALQQLGYPVSDEYVVETVVADIPSGTGGMAIDVEGEIYVGDFGTPDTPGNIVWKVSPDGTVEQFASAEGMRALTSTGFGPDGLLFQSSYGSDEVYTVDAAGNANVLTSEIRSPTGLVATGDGAIYVGSYSVGKIYEVQLDGTTTEWVASRRFNGLNSLSRGPDGTIYTADHKGSSVFAVSADGEVTELVDFPKQTSHVTYHDGSLFVTSRTAYVVFRYDLETGEIEIVAGNGEPGDQDGRGAESSFGSPNALAVGPDGALYMNHGDGANSFPVTIRRITHQP